MYLSWTDAMSWIQYIDIIGTLVFAISGVLTAIAKRFDIVGSIVIGFVTALGGGTLRDVLIGETPVGWMNDTIYLWIIAIAVLISYVFKNSIQNLRRSLFLFDTLGIGLFTILGLQKTLALGLHIPVAIMMGIVSAVFGGVIRDVLTNEVPLIFRKEIYATACLIGALAYVILDLFSPFVQINMISSMLIVVLIRYLSIKYKWSLNFSE